MYQHHKCIIQGTEIQRMCYKCNGIAEKPNKEWLGNLVISSSKKQIPLLCWGLVPMACCLIHWYFTEMSVYPCLFFSLGPGVLQFSFYSLISLAWPFKGPLEPGRGQKRNFSLSMGTLFSLMLLPSYTRPSWNPSLFPPFFWEKIIYLLDECREWEF